MCDCLSGQQCLLSLARITVNPYSDTSDQPSGPTSIYIRQATWISPQIPTVPLISAISFSCVLFADVMTDTQTRAPIYFSIRYTLEDRTART